MSVSANISTGALSAVAATPGEPDGPKDLNSGHITIDLVADHLQRPVPVQNDPIRYQQSCSTAHMVSAKWTAKDGWETPVIKAYGPLMLDPAASVLHYGTESFEGMKLYRGHDNCLRLFRPDLNCARFIMSCERVSLPSFDPKQLLLIIKKFLAIEGTRWLPEPGTFIYVRPTMIGNGAAIGIRKPEEALFYCFAVLFPSFDTDLGMKLIASESDMIRAWPGGFGYAKIGANYGPAIKADAEARSLGFSQPLWLFGDDEQVTEAGASNFFILWRRKVDNKLELRTAPLGNKMILDGVTRRSVLEIARERLVEGAARLPDTVEALEIVEQSYTMQDVKAAFDEGRMVEAFTSGTAVFIGAVSMVRYRREDLFLPTKFNKHGDRVPVHVYSGLIKGWIKDIMYGAEVHDWAQVITE